MSTLIDLFNKPAPDDTSNRPILIRDTLVEFLSTTVFLYTSLLSVVGTGRKLVGQGVEQDIGRILPIAIVFGVSVMGMAFAMGHLSGGHMNPAVSLMMFIKRQISFTRMACYMVAQFAGSVLAAALVWGGVSNLAGMVAADGSIVGRPPFMLANNALEAPLSAGNGFVLEFMGSFFFFLVIAQTALDKRGIADTPFPAIPIGLVLTAVHVGLIPLTGCGLNPARTFGPSMVTCMTGSENCDEVIGDAYWIYWVGPFFAAFVVAEITTWLEAAAEPSLPPKRPATKPIQREVSAVTTRNSSYDSRYHSDDEDSNDYYPRTLEP